MTGTAATALAVACGLAAAAAFGTGVALQHRQAQLAPVRRGAPFRLLAQLARRRLWLAGIALSAAAYGLQGLALAFGPLALVAPVTAMDLLFALPLAARWARLPMRARDWAGCVLAGGGVAVFLAVAPPSSGRSDAPAQSWLAAFAAVAVLAGVAVSTAVLTSGDGPGRRAGRGRRYRLRPDRRGDAERGPAGPAAGPGRGRRALAALGGAGARR